MKLSGRYALRLSGDTQHMLKVSGANPNQIGYLMQRLLTGEEAGVEQEMPYWGITVEQVREADLSALRGLTEDDVELALGDSYVGDLADIEPAKLLELFNLLLDRFAGQE